MEPVVSDSVFGICTRTVSNALLFFESVVQKDIEFTEKETPRDLVSEADLAIQNIVTKEIGSSPYPLVSEEKDNELRDLRRADYCWVLDPIDGTTNFAAKIPLFGVSLGLLKKGRPFAGAFGMPRTKELFYMIDENVAYLNEKRLSVREKTLDKALVGVSFSSRGYGPPSARAKEFELFGNMNDVSRGALRLGSAATNICYVAAGKLGIAYGHRNKVWDVAGALAIAAASGCMTLTTELNDDASLSFLVGLPRLLDTIRARVEAALGLELKGERP